jgi:hypothetical protein
MKAAAIFLFVLGTPLIAGSLDAEFGALVSGVVGNPAINACANNIVHTDGSLVSVPSCLVFSAINPFNSQPESYSISGSASADYSGIHTLATATVSNVDLQAGSLQMSAYGRIIDNLVITDPNIAFLSLVFDVNGSVSTSGFNLSRDVISFGFNYGGTSPVPVEQFVAGSNTNQQFITYAIPVALWNTMPYFVSSAAQNLLTNQTTTSANASGTIDFSHSLTLAGVGVWDANGNLLSNSSITSAGGVSLPVLNVNEAFAPEPSSEVLFTAGLGLVALGLKRQPRQRR